jgi:hypothetical protein
MIETSAEPSRSLRSLPDQDSFEYRRAAPIILVRLQLDRLAGMPLHQPVGTDAFGVGSEVLVAHVAVLLLGHDALHVHDGRDTVGGNAQHHKIGRIGLVEGENQRRVVGRGDPLIHIVLREPVFSDRRRIAEAELDDALHAEGDILGGRHVSGWKLDTLAKVERDLLPIRRNIPAFREHWNRPALVRRIEIDQVVASVLHDLVRDYFADLSRIKGRDGVDIPCHDQRAGRCCRPRRERQRGQDTSPDHDAEKAMPDPAPGCPNHGSVP